VTILLLCADAACANMQSLDSIRAAAEQFISTKLPGGQARHYVTAARLDARLRLDECGAPLETFSTTPGVLGARTTVGVRCAATVQWTLYVPVSVEVEIPVLVLRRALARRARVEPIDVEIQLRRLPGTASNFISDIGNLRGQRLKRSLPAGSALTVDALAPEVLVHRGQQVTLIAASGPIEIRAQGHALAEGGASDRIRVQNLSSLKVVEGVIENATTVRVGP
jgi:flagellar basal body P-ring formation protein FlgA